MATDAIDILDEVEPTERMVELNEQAHSGVFEKDSLTATFFEGAKRSFGVFEENSSTGTFSEGAKRSAGGAVPEAFGAVADDRATRENTLRSDQSGSMTTDDYSISEAIERL